MATMRTKDEAISLLLRRIKLNGDCWEWLGAKTGQGYGAIRYDGKEHSTHRLSFEAFFGNIPDGLFICHRCDNKPCVNPAHLFAGTQQDNTNDKMVKGRWKLTPNDGKGSLHGKAILEESQVLQMRALRHSGMRYGKIGTLFGVGEATAYYAIKNGWKHI